MVKYCLSLLIFQIMIDIAKKDLVKEYYKKNGLLSLINRKL